MEDICEIHENLNFFHFWFSRYLLSWRQKQLDKLVDEDEIAKCFLRQKEFKNANYESSEVNFHIYNISISSILVQIAELGRILKADVDEIWKTKAQKNENEIREEYRLVKRFLWIFIIFF